MIIGVFHQGSGLGNQLHRYVATRVRATDLGVDWEMAYSPDGSGKQQGFKGDSFINIPWGHHTAEQVQKPFRRWDEKKITENGIDIRSYDPEFNFIEDDTVIDGEFQDERYWEHREKEVNEWLKVEPLEMPDDLCVIGFRGGEFALYPDLFLTKEYWDKGIKMMRDINPSMRFEVHTDDKILAQQFFPDFQVIHDIGINWRSVRFARYAIISNSSFFVLPRWLKQGELHNAHELNGYLGITENQIKEHTPVTIAPRYWGRRNTKVWSLPQNYYKRFTYL